MNKAKYLCTLKGKGEKRLYQLTPPLNGHDHVVVSAVDVSWPLGNGPETYIFAATEFGEITNYMDLPGSFRGALDHERALKNAGYEIEE